VTNCGDLEGDPERGQFSISQNLLLDVRHYGGQGVGRRSYGTSSTYGWGPRTKYLLLTLLVLIILLFFRVRAHWAWNVELRRERYRLPQRWFGGCKQFPGQNREHATCFSSARVGMVVEKIRSVTQSSDSGGDPWPRPSWQEC